MTFRHTTSALAAVVTIALPICGIAQENPTAETVVATVDGTDITLGHMIVLKQRLPAQYKQLPPDVLFDGIIDQLVQQTLLGSQIQELPLGARMTLDNEARALRANQELRRVAAAAMTDEALQAAYDEAYGTAEPEVEYNASHILVASEEEALALVTDLEGGADFAELAKEKSTGPSGPRGGELGWFAAGAMVAPFEEAVMAMDAGAISAAVQTQFGWHIIKLNETRLKNAPSLEDVRGELMDTVQRVAVEARVEELTGTAEITRKNGQDIDPAVLDDLSLLEN